MINGGLLVFLFAVLGVGALSQEGGVSRDELHNATRDFQWNSSYYDEKIINESTSAYSIRLHNVLMKSIDWLGYVYFEVAKWGLEFGFDHPGVDYIFFMKVLVVYLIITVIAPFGIVVVYVFAAVYFLVQGIKGLKEKRRTKKK